MNLDFKESYMGKLLKSETVKNVVLLEAERVGKNFQLIEVNLKKVWKKNNYRFVGIKTTETYNTFSKTYEFKWKSSNSDRWGRTEILNAKGNAVSQSEAFKKFFQAMDAADNMTFTEL